MGIAKDCVNKLLEEGNRKTFDGLRVLTLGRQVIHSGNVLGIGRDNELFAALGFSEYKVLDFSKSQKPHYLFDLNNYELPANLYERFDVIIDGGTCEHIFHVPNVLNNLYKILTTGGRIIHFAPSSNHMDHGFYMFSPTLFWDFYTINNFEINKFQTYRYTSRHAVDPWKFSDYTPGCLKDKSFGGLDSGMYGIFVVVTKLKNSTGHIVPQQGVYVDKDKKD